MNPDTGTFHSVEEKKIAEEMEETNSIMEAHYKKRKGRGEKNPQLHPSHAKLVLSASKKPVPAHWPIFSIGESIEIEDLDTEGLCTGTITAIKPKDILCKLEGPYDFTIKDTIFLKGYEFKVRKTYAGGSKDNFIVIRPAVGRPHNYVS